MGLSLFLTISFMLCSSSSLLTQSLHTARDGKEYYVVKVRSLLPSHVCSPSKESNLHHNKTGRLKVYSRHGPCSPSSSFDLSQLLLHDSTRAASLRNRLQPSSPSVSLPTFRGSSVGTSNYVTTISLGSPTRQLTAIIDTGSVLTWFQCEPCIVNCHPQVDPIFDPSLSSSYSNVSCPTSACSSLLSATGQDPTCSDDQCLYSIKYGDGSYSVGLFARDTLTLSPSQNIPNFLFGCSESDDGFFGKTAGLLGLGRDPLSIISQSADTYSRVFSYCLPTTSSSTGHLTFGPAAAHVSYSYTPMLTDPDNPSFYFIDLVGIRVGGQSLPIDPVIFRAGGTIIDSGTVITRLPTAAYAALRSAFKARMGAYGAAATYSILDTCFDFGGKKMLRLPTVEMVFGGGVALRVEPEGLLVGPSANQLCLAFASNSDDGDVGIIGNWQQVKTDVVYDVANSRIGFGAGGCQ